MTNQFNAAPQDWLPSCGVRIHMFPSQDKAKAHALAHWAEKKTKNSNRPVTAFVSLSNVESASAEWQVVLRNW